jgi:hypothetical protein
MNGFGARPAKARCYLHNCAPHGFAGILCFPPIRKIQDEILESIRDSD